MPDVRVYFTKLGALRYISHLDLQRALARLLIRSGLPIGYTEGFNPHPRLNIALPLSVYQEGEREVFDFRLEEYVPESVIVEKLSKNMFPGCSVLGAEYIEKKSSPKSAVYRITMATDMTADEFKSALGGEMIVTKRSKSGEKRIDIAPMITLVGAESGRGFLTVRLLLPASGGDYLNPSYVAAYFGDRIGDTRIVRENINF